MFTDYQAAIELPKLQHISSAKEILQIYLKLYSCESHPLIDYNVASILSTDDEYRSFATIIYAKVCLNNLGVADNLTWNSIDRIHGIGISYLALFRLLCLEHRLDSKMNLGCTMLKLAMVYLSRAISFKPYDVFESYAFRGLTVEIAQDFSAIQSDLFSIPGQESPGPTKIYALSDYYYSSLCYQKHGYREDALSNLANATFICKQLKFSVVDGQLAGNISLPDLAEIGRKRYETLVAKLNQEYESGVLNLDYSSIFDLLP
jgi:hypothetical protein